MGSRFTVGPFIVHSSKNVIERDGHRVRIEPKAMRVLVHLASRVGENVGRDELLHVVWNGSSVRAEALSNVIWEIRRALGDDPREPDFIQTVLRKGYRLVAPVARRETVTTWARALIARLHPPGRSPFLDGKRSALQKLLESRFGALPLDVANAISSLSSSEEIDRAIDASLKASSPDSLIQSLPIRGRSEEKR
ncbi:MAG TPA: winged helix-turn-helix domain-containing protein [Vicinamibacteria bacterium]|nr:winged helix-turn-helix domain-containing protein [Vicinamibacteria bacterium]